MEISDEECVAIRRAIDSGLELVAGGTIYASVSIEMEDQMISADPEVARAVHELRATSAIGHGVQVAEWVWATSVAVARTDDHRFPFLATMPVPAGNAPPPATITWEIEDRGWEVTGPRYLFYTAQVRAVDRRNGPRGGSIVDLRTPWATRPDADPNWPPVTPPSPELRRTLEQVIDRLIAGDFEGLVHDGMVFGVDTLDEIDWIESLEGSDTPLVPLPDDQWEHRARVIGDASNDGWFCVDLDLWDETGPSGLTLSIDIERTGETLHPHIQNVHML